MSLKFPKTMYLGSSNSKKYLQYASIFRSFGVELKWVTEHDDLLIEPQISSNIRLAIEYPLMKAAKIVESEKTLPFVVEDTALFIDEFSVDYQNFFGLPGADTKNWWAHMGSEKILRSLKDAESRKAKYLCQLGVYFGGGKFSYANGSCNGTISHTKKHDPISKQDLPDTNPYYFHEIFIPNGSKSTFSEMGREEFIKFDYRQEAVKNLFSNIGASQKDQQKQF